MAFANNKGGVGKSTLAYNTAVKFANKGYKTVLIDLDPQCNLTRLALGDEYYENTVFSMMYANIHDVLRGVIRGGSDIRTDIEFEPAKGAASNLYLLRGDIRLSEYENLLATAYGQAASGYPIGYFQTSAIDRFLRVMGMANDVDIFVVDTSPTLGLLNRVILLGIDYFVVPLAPDALSLQGIENLGTIYSQWKENWHNTGQALSGNIESKNVLSGEGLFIGYILNEYNVYGQQPIRDHRRWIEQIPSMVKKYLSEKHCRNGLVAASSEKSLMDIQDYGRLPSLAQEYGCAIFDIDPAKAEAMQLGTRNNIQKANAEFDELADNILKVLERY